jgi:hypothetical protein
MSLLLEKETRDKLAAILRKIDGMKHYCMLKYEHEDWHGVMDAAADIRELVAEQTALENVLDSLTEYNKPI